MAEEQNAEDVDIYTEETRKDAEAIESYLQNVYSLQVPPPQKPTPRDLSFWDIAGLESSIFVSSALGAAILSAIRTSGLFFLLEMLLMQKYNIDPLIGGGLGFIAAIASLLAFEGFLLGYGVVKGKRSGKMEVSTAGMIISFVTVVAAGIFSSLSIVTINETLEIVINTIMAVITGGAAAAVAFFASENFGYIQNSVAAKRNEKLFAHQEAINEWREKGVATYKRSHYNIRSSKSIYGNHPLKQNQDSKEVASISPSSKKRPGEQVRDYIVEVINSENRLPSQKEIQAALGINASTSYYSFIEFVVANQVNIFKRGYMSAEEIEKYILALAKKNKVDPSQYRKDLTE